MTTGDDFTTLRDYFEQQLARLALVLDPPGLLVLGDAVEVEGRLFGSEASADG